MKVWNSALVLCISLVMYSISTMITFFNGYQRIKIITVRVMSNVYLIFIIWYTCVHVVYACVHGCVYKSVYVRSQRSIWMTVCVIVNLLFGTRSLHWSWNLVIGSGWLEFISLPIFLPPPPLSYRYVLLCLLFCIGHGDAHPVLHACMADTVLIEPSLEPAGLVDSLFYLYYLRVYIIVPNI